MTDSNKGSNRPKHLTKGDFPPTVSTLEQPFCSSGGADVVKSKETVRNNKALVLEFLNTSKKFYNLRELTTELNKLIKHKRAIERVANVRNQHKQLMDEVLTPTQIERYLVEMTKEDKVKTIQSRANKGKLVYYGMNDSAFDMRSALKLRNRLLKTMGSITEEAKQIILEDILSVLDYKKEMTPKDITNLTVFYTFDTILSVLTNTKDESIEIMAKGNTFKYKKRRKTEVTD